MRCVFILLMTEADGDCYTLYTEVGLPACVNYVFVAKALVGLVIVAPTRAAIELGFAMHSS